MTKPQVSIIVPLYNEEETFKKLIDRLNDVIKEAYVSIEVVLIDDGSTDRTSLLMTQLSTINSTYKSIFLSRNYGHQIALTAGLDNSIGTECVFIIDGDLQDPPELLLEFYEKMIEGYDIVYAIRKKRKEGIIKKVAYKYFYRIQNSIVKLDIPMDSGDFSLLSRKVVEILKKMPEESRYIRGLRSWIGLNQCGIEYDRSERKYGTSKYSMKMLFKLAYDGIFNFTEFPIKLITNLGIISISISLIYLFITLFRRFFFGDVPEGFTGLLFTIVLFSGVQLICIGILGEYLIRVFFQTKDRPLYIIKSKIINKEILDE